MQKVIGIKFNTPKVYYFAPGDAIPQEGDGVVVETVKGVGYGEVVMPVCEMEDDKIVAPLKPIMRVATPEDKAKHETQLRKAADARPIIQQKIEARGLNMKPVSVEYTFDTGKLIVYFTADGRVDFRDLVRDMATAFHTRIELRQIGARDECRMKGGIAPCGRACCCSDHMPDFAHVSIKMAKTQGLSLNPTKISGLCGRLMCCLSYENAHYAETNKKMPKIGSAVTLPDGKSGTAISLNQLKETVRVKTETKDGYELNDYPLSELTFKGKPLAHEVEKSDDKEDELKELLAD